MGKCIITKWEYLSNTWIPRFSIPDFSCRFLVSIPSFNQGRAGQGQRNYFFSGWDGMGLGFSGQGDKTGWDSKICFVRDGTGQGRKFKKHKRDFTFYYGFFTVFYSFFTVFYRFFYCFLRFFYFFLRFFYFFSPFFLLFFTVFTVFTVFYCF